MFVPNLKFLSRKSIICTNIEFIILWWVSLRCMILFRNVTAALTGKFERLIITPLINVITTSNIEEEDSDTADGAEHGGLR